MKPDDTGILSKTALVTGAAQGIGRATAMALASHGASVAALDKDTERLAATVAEIRAKGLEARAYSVDVRDSAAVERVVDQVEVDLGPIGILTNVAGVMRLGSAVTFSDEDWLAVFDVNTHGVFYVCRAVARRMAARGEGTVVVIGSNAGGVPRTRMAAYAASKAATASFVKCLGLELGRSGIRCNIVSPGSTDTAMLRATWDSGHHARETIEGVPQDYRVGIPLGKIASPEDIAETVVFLASNQAGHITMQDLYVDGGAALGV